MKKKLCLASFLALLVLLLVGCSFGQGNSLKYVSNGDGTCYVSGYKSSLPEKLTIPEVSPKGDKVVAVGDGAFQNCERLRELTVPSTVVKIGRSAFESCANLSLVTLSDGVVQIGASAFENCSLLTAVSLGNTVEIIGDHAFFYCKSLTDIQLPASVTIIGELAFSRCVSLTSLEIPEGVSVLRDSLFMWCDSLEHVVIPKSVVSIGENVFLWCASLQAVYYRGSDADWNAILISEKNDDLLLTRRYTFSATDPYRRGDFWYYMNGQITVWPPYSYSYGLIYLPEGDGTCTIGGIGTCMDVDLLIPPVSPDGDTVVGIADAAFAACDRIVTLTLPESILTIGERAFHKCASLTTVYMPASVQVIYKDAFASCSALTGVYIEDIAAWCGISFADFDSNPLHLAKKLYCNGELLTSLTIPEGVTEIRPYAFWACESLTFVRIGNDVVTIGSWAFRNCTSLDKVVVGNSVQKIGSHAFQYCDQLRVLNIGMGVAEIGYAAFSGCFRLSDVLLGNGVARIDIYAFSDCAALKKIYYTADALSFSQIVIASDNEPFKDAIVYFYSELPPTEEGNFWYVSNGAVTPWETEAPKDE